MRNLKSDSLQSLPWEGTVPPPGKGEARRGSFCTLLFSLLISLQVFAQENTNTETTNTTDMQEKTTDAPTEKKAPEKKMISEANINLRTTVTGNQEQPMVMYILPWQSPDSPEFDLEMQSSQAEAVFGHIEREELNRQLDAAGELDQD